MKLIIIFCFLSLECSAQKLNSTQRSEVTAIVKGNTDPLWKALTIAQKTITADSIRINNLEKEVTILKKSDSTQNARIKFLEDYNLKYSGELYFDTSIIGGFKATRLIDKYLIQVRK